MRSSTCFLPWTLQRMHRVLLVVLVSTTMAGWRAAAADDFYKLVPLEGGQFREPHDLALIRERVYFVAAHDEKGPAIWATDGTSQGTRRITPYETFSKDQQKSYDMAKKEAERDPSAGEELMQQLKDARLNLNRPHDVRGVGDSGLFYFTQLSYSAQVLWFMDETNASLAEVRRFMSAGVGNPESVEFEWGVPVVGSRIMFLCRTKDSGCELWSSDGTPSGTGLVRDLAPGPADAFVPRGLQSPWAVCADRVYFSAPDESGAPCLWSSDGTAAGTRMDARLTDEGENAARPAEGFVVQGGRLFFFRGGLWVSDGTEEGTKRLQRGLLPTGIVSCDDYVYFVASAPNEEGTRLWRTDGTEEGTAEVITPKPMRVLGQSGTSILYTDSFSVHATDGDPATTGLVQGLLPYDVPIWDVRLRNDRLFMLADDYERPLEHSLYVSQTVGVGARCLKRNVMTQFFSELQEPVALGSCVFFILPDMAPGAIWVYRHDEDASPPEWPREAASADAGQRASVKPFRDRRLNQEPATRAEVVAIEKEGYAVFDLYPGRFDSCPRMFTEAGGRVFFRARTRDNREALWVSDGTSGGTREAGRPNPFSLDDAPGKHRIQDITGLGDKVVFAASDGEHGMELWCSDGTSGGTRQVADLTAGYGSTFTQTLRSKVGYFARVGERLFFWQGTGTGNHTLWFTDGTPEGTRSVRSFRTGSPRGRWLADGERLFFVTGPGNNVSQLWVTDGTTNGTVLFAEHKWKTTLIASLHGRMYYTSDSYTLFSTDGTADGTIRHNEEFDVANAASTDDVILFYGSRPDDSRKAGIFAIHDDPFSVEMVWPTGGRYRGPDAFVASGQRVVFKFPHYDAYHVCDGTRTGTRPLWEGELFENAFFQSGKPCRVGEDVYFAASGELWRIPENRDKAERCLRPQAEGVGEDPDVGIPHYAFDSIASVGDFLITSGAEPEYGEEVYVIDRK